MRYGRTYAAILPGYMRPRDIMVVDAIPLLPNGKFDRKALRLPVQKNRPNALACSH